MVRKSKSGLNKKKQVNDDIEIIENNENNENNDNENNENDDNENDDNENENKNENIENIENTDENDNENNENTDQNDNDDNENENKNQNNENTEENNTDENNNENTDKNDNENNDNETLENIGIVDLTDHVVLSKTISNEKKRPNTKTNIQQSKKRKKHRSALDVFETMNKLFKQWEKIDKQQGTDDYFKGLYEEILFLKDKQQAPQQINNDPFTWQYPLIFNQTQPFGVFKASQFVGIGFRYCLKGEKSCDLYHNWFRKARWLVPYRIICTIVWEHRKYDRAQALFIKLISNADDLRNKIWGLQLNMIEEMRRLLPDIIELSRKKAFANVSNNCLLCGFDVTVCEVVLI